MTNVVMRQHVILRLKINYKDQSKITTCFLMKLGGKWLGTFSSLLWTWILWFLSNRVQKLKGFVIPKGMFIVFELKELTRFDKIDIVVVGVTKCYGHLVGKGTCLSPMPKLQKKCHLLTTSWSCWFKFINPFL